MNFSGTLRLADWPIIEETEMERPIRRPSAKDVSRTSTTSIGVERTAKPAPSTGHGTRAVASRVPLWRLHGFCSAAARHNAGLLCRNQDGGRPLWAASFLFRALARDDGRVVLAVMRLQTVFSSLRSGRCAGAPRPAASGSISSGSGRGPAPVDDSEFLDSFSFDFLPIPHIR